MPLGRLGVAPPVGTAVTPGAASATTGRPPRSTRTWKLPPVAGEKLVTPTLSVPPSLTMTLRRDSVRLPRQSSLVSGAAPGGVTSKMGSNSVAVSVTTTCSPASTGTFRFTCPPGASCPSCSKSGRAAWPGCCAGAPVGDPPEPEQPTETAPSRAMRQSLSFTVAFLSQAPGEPAATKESYAVGVGVVPCDPSECCRQVEGVGAWRRGSGSRGGGEWWPGGAAARVVWAPRAEAHRRQTWPRFLEKSSPFGGGLGGRKRLQVEG
jgi:hypothetical protein